MHTQHITSSKYFSSSRSAILLAVKTVPRMRDNGRKKARRRLFVLGFPPALGTGTNNRHLLSSCRGLLEGMVLRGEEKERLLGACLAVVKFWTREMGEGWRERSLPAIGEREEWL